MSERSHGPACEQPLLAATLTAALLLAISLAVFAAPQAGAHAAAGHEPQASPSVAASGPLTYTVNLPAIFHKYPPDPSMFGVQMYSTVGVALTADIHTTWVRIPISWAAVEVQNTNPPTYNWGPFDANMQTLSQAGRTVIATLIDAPSWAATYRNGPIDKVSPARLADFLKAAAERYDGDGYQDAPGRPVVNYWELYNEPDGGVEARAVYGQGYWGNYGKEYAQMLCTVYPAIHAANSHARVLQGGIASDWFTDGGDPNGPYVRRFLDDVLSNGGGQCIDGMNFHYYPAYALDWAAYGPGLLGKANYIRSRMAAHGVDKPLYITELGWYSDSTASLERPSSPQIQARYVVQLYSEALAANAVTGIWFSWLNPGAGYLDYGLLTEDLQPKPAFNAYAYMVTRLGRTAAGRLLSSGEMGSSAAAGAVEGYVFTLTSGQAVYVVWSIDSSTHAVSVPLARARVTNIYGSVIATVNDGDDGTADGKVTITAGLDPVYVEAAN